MAIWEPKRILITVRTYPTPAQKGVEVSCSAGITDQNEWIRLFPIPYRLMDYERRFRKYEWIELKVKKASDYRRESYNPDVDSIAIGEWIPSGKNKWAERKDIVYPLRSHCLCCLKAERKKNKRFPTLGLFKPRSIERLVIEPDTPDWTPDQLVRLQQQTLFEIKPARKLEKIPFRFKYEFHCDHDECKGHSLTCTDWELHQAYREWRPKYGDPLWIEKFRQRWELEMVEKNDTHFYVGTMHGYPGTWIIVGLFYPRL